jgi:altronate dehydratase
VPLEAEETKIAKATEKMKMSEPTLVEEIDTAALEASSKIYDYIVRHASGKKLSEKEVFEANHYAKGLKYPKGH